MDGLTGASLPKRVCLVHTGGTIGMHRTDQGYAPQAGVLKAALDALPELHTDGMPSWDLIEFDPLLDSSNIAVSEWVKLARTIAEHYRDYDGFVVLHGTDTMAYTASALSFMLDGLAKPVIITGSQIPLCEIRNDARDNVITALLIAVDEATPPEVSLYFGGMLYRGNRATKVSSDELIAFDSPNTPPLALAGVRIEFQRAWLYQRRHQSSGLSVSPFSPQKIAVLKIFPGIQFDVFSSMLDDGLGGLVLEAFGAGNIPESDALHRFLEKAEAKGTVIVVCTQCLRGAATIGQYEASSMLAQAGAVSGYDLTVEAAVTKLYYLLSLELDRAAVKQLMQTNLRGEITLPD
jgi:L-asparaginase